LVLLQPDSSSNTPGAGGKYCNNGVDLRAKKKFTEAESKQRAKEHAKERNAKEAGTTAVVTLPIEVRAAWEQLPKERKQGNLKAWSAVASPICTHSGHVRRSQLCRYPTW
jgi:hypothetical protein